MSLFHVLRPRTRFQRYRGCPILFSCFPLPDMFLAVPRASGPFFMFCALGLDFGCNEGVGSLFHVFRSRTHFRRYRGRLVPFSCFERPDSFSAVPGASGPVLMFSAPRLIFGGTEGVRSRPHVLRARTRFQRYRGRRVPFSSFALPDSFSTLPRASGPVFMFCALGLIFCCTEGVQSRFHVSRSRTCFCPYRGRRVHFSCFALPNSFSTVPRVSGPIFMYCAPRLIFDGTECVGSRFHFLRAQTNFRLYRGRPIPFLCFPLPDMFLAIPRASGPFFMFCAPGLFFGNTKGVWSLFHIFRSRTHFRRYRGRRVPFSCFEHPDSFSAVPGASGPVFMYCAPGLVFGGTGGVGPVFHVLLSRTHFRRYRWRPAPVFMLCVPGLFFSVTQGVDSRFHVLRSRTHFRRYRGRLMAIKSWQVYR
jgi:hypothetical protein